MMEAVNRVNNQAEAGEKTKRIKPKKKKPIWITTTIAASLGRRELLAATFKEIVFHFISLVFLSIYIFTQANASEYYLSEALKNAFDVDHDLEQVDSVHAFWEYLKHNVLDVFYGPEIEADEINRNKTGEEDDDKDDDKEKVTEHPSTMDKLFILDENLVLGVPRIRQVKVTNNSCEIHGYFRRLVLDCYHAFGSKSEDESSFGLGKPTAWTFSPDSATKSVRYWGTLTSYSGGGFFMDFSKNSNETNILLTELQDNLWITRGTRAVFLDFSIYNPNLNLYCICKIIFEFLPAGGVTPSFRFSPANLTPFVDKWYWTLRIMLYLFSIYVIYSLCEEIREMFYFKGQYFIQFWNYVDLTVIMLTGLLVAGTEYMRAVIGSYIEDISSNPDRYGNLETPRVIYQVVRISGALLLFFVYMRTFKYLNFNRRMAQLNNTLRNCSKDILGFSVMFFVAYIAFAELGYLVFGSEVDDFRSFGQSTFTLLRTILGDFDYEKIHAANWVVAPVYFLTFIILVFFVLLNMFLAIVNDTYADVKTDIAIAPKEMEMSEYVSQKYHDILRKLGCKAKPEKEREKLISSNINEIRDALIKCNYDDREIAMYFTRYDIDPLKDLKKQDIETFYEMFAQEDITKKQGEENVVTLKDIQRQDDKLVELENSLVMLGQRVHDLLLTIENIQGTQRPL